MNTDMIVLDSPHTQNIVADFVRGASAVTRVFGTPAETARILRRFGPAIAVAFTPEEFRTLEVLTPRGVLVLLLNRAKKHARTFVDGVDEAGDPDIYPHMKRILAQFLRPAVYDRGD
ncbi:unnamed protein product, partial [marine sediment metagenome]